MYEFLQAPNFKTHQLNIWGTDSMSLAGVFARAFVLRGDEDATPRSLQKRSRDQELDF